MDALRAHAWPGNIRELENAIERAILLCDGTTLGPRDLPPELSAGARPPRRRPKPRRSASASAPPPNASSATQSSRPSA